MDITKLPFNELIGLEREDPATGLLVSLPEHPKYTNHIGTVHAAALLAVAEAGSGECLLRHFGHMEGAVPLVRTLAAKFRKPAHGRVAARCDVSRETIDGWLGDLSRRGRLSITLPVEVVDSQGEVVMSATVEWFIATERIS